MPGLKTIYSKDGTPITDIKASVIRSSLLNEVGEAVFFMSTASTKSRREVLEYGNFLYIQNDSLPDWVGVIDTPRVWHHGYVEVHAFEPQFLLAYRLAPLNGIIEGTPGEKFTDLLAVANGREDTLIRAGNVFTGGISSQETMTGSVGEHIKKIRENAKHDWILTPNIDAAGRLTIIMDWLEKAGVLTDLELSQGQNILYGDTPLEESGELINSIQAVSDVTGGTQTVTTYQDDTARSTNGLREVRQSLSGTSEVTALTSNTKQIIDLQKSASLSTPLTAVNVGSTFANIRIGNIVKYKYTDVGFDGDVLGMSQFVRIEGYRFDESNGTCELFTGKVV